MWLCMQANCSYQLKTFLGSLLTGGSSDVTLLLFLGTGMLVKTPSSHHEPWSMTGSQHRTP